MIGAAGGTVTGRVVADRLVRRRGGRRPAAHHRHQRRSPPGSSCRTGAVDQGSLAGDLLGSVAAARRADRPAASTPEEMALALETLRGGGFVGYDDGAVAAGPAGAGADR